MSKHEAFCFAFSFKAMHAAQVKTVVGLCNLTRQLGKPESLDASIRIAGQVCSAFLIPWCRTWSHVCNPTSTMVIILVRVCVIGGLPLLQYPARPELYLMLMLRCRPSQRQSPPISAGLHFLLLQLAWGCYFVDMPIEAFDAA